MRYASPNNPDSLVRYASRYDNFIGGEWVAPTEGRYFENVSPVTGRPFCEIARSTAEDVERALDAAHGAKARWGRMAAAERAAVLSRIADVMEENLEWRSLRHPPLDTEPSVGSIFKKIEGIGAGRLIDECGLKGAKIGGARVTHRHANIFVNDGDATAADLIALIRHVQDVVESETGYRLETEIGFIGEFDDPSADEPVFVPKDPDLVTAADLAKQRQAAEAE